ncbi:MAG: hypothetical protein LBF83_00300, partial [Spirochaetaceae bacterium]|nr:hypothetical protein [Spirochaetaceae bacterium]
LAACDAAGGNEPPPPAGDDWQQGIMSESTAKVIFDYSHQADGVRINLFKSVPALAAWLGVETTPDTDDVEASLPDRTLILKTIAGNPVTAISEGAFARSDGNDISSLISAVSLPDTIQLLGADLFKGVKNPVNMEIPPVVVELLGETALIAAAGGDAGVVPAAPAAPGDAPPVPIVHPRPGLHNSAVNYDSGAGAVSVTFTFNMDVTVPPGEGVVPNGSSVTVTPQGATPGLLAAISLEAANSADPDKTTTVTAEYMPVDGVFNRSALSGAYTLLHYDKNGAVGLKDSDSAKHWRYVLPEEERARRLFDTIYTANLAVLGLFWVTFGEPDRVEVKGTELPPASAGTAVVDIGLTAEDNNGLPAFYIPYGGLGAEGEDYAHIRIRVNRGAYLVIEADNSGGEAAPGLTGCEVEVAGGGRLRSEADEGSPSPLGQAAITARLGSWLAVGPDEAPDGGWLVGPSGSGARLLWGAGDQNGSYIEIRGDRIAFDANLTLRKSLVLAYNVGFIGGPALTIDIQQDDPGINGRRGLFAGGSGYKFYGTKSSSGGQNPSKPAAQVIIKPGSSISRSFLTSADGGAYITAANSEIKVNNNGSSTPGLAEFTASGTTKKVYFNWNVLYD